MGKLLIAFMLLFNTGAFAADSWLPAAQLIPEGVSTEVNYDVYTTYNAANHTVVATWADIFGEITTPIYAVYNGSTWITPGTIIPQGDSNGVYHNIIPQYYPANHTVVAVWNDSDSSLPYYAVFNGTTWTTVGTQIPLGTSTGADNDIYLTYQVSNQTIVAAWSDVTNQAPYYSVFDGTNWITTDLIPLGTSTGVLTDVTLTYDAATQSVIAAWADVVTNLPYYAVFDGTTWTTPGTLIPVGVSAGAKYNISLVYNPANQTVVAAWGDSSTSSPIYAVFNGTTWITPGTLIPQGVSVGVYQGISLAYNSDSQTVFGAWSDSADYIPFYSIFNGTTWTPGALLPYTPSAGIDYDVILVYDPAVHQMIATWGQYPGAADPYFNIYVTSIPPGNFTGSGCCVSFATQKVWVNHLAWSPGMGTGIIAYNIYRNGLLIAQVNAATFVYNDLGNRVGADVYTVTSLGIGGVESPSANVTIHAHRSCH